MGALVDELALLDRTSLPHLEESVITGEIAVANLKSLGGIEAQPLKARVGQNTTIARNAHAEHQAQSAILQLVGKIKALQPYQEEAVDLGRSVHQVHRLEVPSIDQDATILMLTIDLIILSTSEKGTVKAIVRETEIGIGETEIGDHVVIEKGLIAT